MTDQEINEAVARKLGVGRELASCEHRDCEGDYSDYCHCIAEAWEIVQTIHTPWVLRQQEVKVCAKEYEFKDGMCAPYVFSIQSGMEWIVAQAESASMAICLAFLKLSKGEYGLCQTTDFDETEIGINTVE